MNCPACGQAVEDSAASCDSCGQDTRLTMMALDGSVYGPYTMADIRTYATVGRVPLGTTLRAANGKMLTLNEVGLGTIVADSAFAGPVRYSPLSRGTKWGTVALVLAVALPIVGIGVAMMAGFGRGAFAARGQAQENMCRQQFAQLALGVRLYVEAHNGVLPNVNTWKQDVAPYVIGDASTFVCASSRRGQNSYDFNSAISGRPAGTIRDPVGTPMIYETGLLEGRGPHRGGGHVMYVDGHVKWVHADAF